MSKPCAAEQARERTEGEVRAVLVVDVPERDLVEHASVSGSSNRTVTSRPPDGTPADERDEVGDAADVLERVAAHDDVGRRGRSTARRRTFRTGNAIRAADRRARPLGATARVDADPAIRRRLAMIDEELALAAADLEDVACRGCRNDRPTLGELLANAWKRGEKPCVSSYVERVLGRAPTSNAVFMMKPQRRQNAEADVAARESECLVGVGKSRQLLAGIPRCS